MHCFVSNFKYAVQNHCNWNTLNAHVMYASSNTLRKYSLPRSPASPTGNQTGPDRTARCVLELELCCDEIYCYIPSLLVVCTYIASRESKPCAWQPACAPFLGGGVDAPTTTTNNHIGENLRTVGSVPTTVLTSFSGWL